MGKKRRMVKVKSPDGLTAKAYGLAIISGIIASLALPPIGLVVGLFALSIPFIMLGHTRSLRQDFILGWMTGFGWFVFSLYWISNALFTSGGWHIALIPFSGLGLPLFLGLFWGVGFLAVGLVRTRIKLSPPAMLILLVAVLSFTDYLRGHILTGFPWNAAGLVAASADIGLAAAAIVGYWGMGIAVFSMAILPGLILSDARKLAAMVIAALALLGIGAYDHLQRAPSITPATGAMVRLVQPNIAQGEKWQRDLRQSHLTALMTASRMPTKAAQDGLASADLDLIVWPETAFAGSIDRMPGVFKSITQAASSGKTPILTGALREKFSPYRLYNSAVIVAPDGKIIGSADKSHLVPFGEYAPFRSFIPFVDAIAGPIDFSAGPPGQLLEVRRQDSQLMKLLPLICYEIIFPAAVRAHSAEADVIVTITNDAWFGDSIGPRQHLAMAQLRAAELGKPVIRVGNTGISVMINSHGQITAEIPYGEKNTIDVDIGGSLSTLIRNYGDGVYLLLQLLLLFVAAWCNRLTPANWRE